MVPEQVKHFEILLGSQVKQLHAKVQAIHYEGFRISGVQPTGQGHFLVAPSNVIVLSQVKQIETSVGSQVLQLDARRHGVQVDSKLKFIVLPIGQGQSPDVNDREASQLKHVPRLIGSQVRQFFVH